jgi:5'-3' exonuclease
LNIHQTGVHPAKLGVHANTKLIYIKKIDFEMTSINTINIIFSQMADTKIEQVITILKTSIYFPNLGFDNAKIHDLILKNNISTDTIDIICDLLLNDNIPIITDDTDMPVLLCVAVYYEIKKDNNNLEKYLLIASERKNQGAINNLALYYESQG